MDFASALQAYTQGLKDIQAIRYAQCAYSRLFSIESNSTSNV